MYASANAHGSESSPSAPGPAALGLTIISARQTDHSGAWSRTKCINVSRESVVFSDVDDFSAGVSSNAVQHWPVVIGGNGFVLLQRNSVQAR